MIILNFSHPLTAEQRAQIETLTDHAIERVIDVPVQLDHAPPFASQVRYLVEDIDLTSEGWQTQPLLVNPPGYAPAAVTLLAELHGRMGYFPAVVRLRPVPDSTPRRYEVAAIVDLQAVRESARASR